MMSYGAAYAGHLYDIAPVPSGGRAFFLVGGGFILLWGRVYLQRAGGIGGAGGLVNSLPGPSVR